MITCCFDCVEGSAAWEDGREEPLHGRVLHKRSGDEYGVLRDSDWEIRRKMAGLCALTPPRFFINLFFRLGHLLSGHWAWGQGYTRALSSWRLERYQAKVDETGKKQNAPGNAALWIRTALYAVCYFADALAKCATLPIASLLSIGSTLIAITDPLLARRCFAWVEETWSLELERRSSLLLLNYSAPCMQPKRIWDQFDLYPPATERKDPKHLYHQMLTVQHLLQDHKEYFSQQEYDRLSQHVEARYKQIKEDLAQCESKEDRESFCLSKHRGLEYMQIAFEMFTQRLSDLAESSIATQEEKEHNKSNLYQYLNLPFSP